MSDGMGREFAYLSSHATNRYFIPNWGKLLYLCCREELFDSKRMHNAEIGTVAKSLPLLRQRLINSSFKAIL